MRRIYIIFIIILTSLIFVLASCGGQTGEDTAPSASDTYVYVTSSVPSVRDEPSSEETTAEAESTTAVIPSTTMPMPTEPTTISEVIPTEETQPATTVPAAEPSGAIAEPSVTAQTPETTLPSSAENTTVDLSVELPEANGRMEVSTSPDNTFITAVAKAKGTDVSLLAAVYSVPASGQNYVLEFYNASGRTKDDLRRVFLLDDSGRITSIAAAKAAERSNISSTENWFCFNVLIKGVIFDAIADELKR